MAEFNLGKMKLGELDAKNEIVKQSKQNSTIFYDAFIVPPHLDENQIINGSTAFILGNKGTGKTALLRWLKHKIDAMPDTTTELVLFKSHITDEERNALSVQSGFSVVEREKGHFLIEQDFKQYWKLYIHKTIAFAINRAIESGQYTKDENTDRYISIFKKAGENWWSRVSRVLPVTIDGKIDIKLNLEAISANLNLATKKKNARVYNTYTEVVEEIDDILHSIPRTKKTIYVMFDELEVFFEHTDQFDRDRRMVRDLIYSIVQFNSKYFESGPRLHIVSAVRSEIVNSIAKIGQEITRDLTDYGFRIRWDGAFRDGTHPLLDIIENKIRLSYAEAMGRDYNGDIWSGFFPASLGGKATTKETLVYGSLYRPRDIVRRLGTARDYQPSAPAFTQAAFDESALQYSNGIWEEIYEELLASYSIDEIKLIETMFSGFYSYFFLDELVFAIRRRSGLSTKLTTIEFISGALKDLYQLGAVGNDFVVKTRGVKETRQRWIFRGNTELILEERMSLHRSLWKRFSAVDRKGLGKMEIFDKS